jgi:hypothetical protein
MLSTSRDGLHVSVCEFSEFANNTIRRNEYGMRMQIGGNNLIHDNLYEENTLTALGLNWAYPNTRSELNMIYNNRFINNSGYALTISEYSTNVAVYNNQFIGNNNGSCQAFDNGVSTIWTHNGGGNYWDEWTGPDADGDGIVDVPYTINLTFNSIDTHPLVEPRDQPFPDRNFSGFDEPDRNGDEHPYDHLIGAEVLILVTAIVVFFVAYKLVSWRLTRRADSDEAKKEAEGKGRGGTEDVRPGSKGR